MNPSVLTVLQSLTPSNPYLKEKSFQQRITIFQNSHIP